tara:strand:+ start:1307 stop:1975 length:669 start_codon:yes stop_codon:yes gene_type:complete
MEKALYRAAKLENLANRNGHRLIHLSKDMLLYRMQPPNISNITPMPCDDTGKTGIYFSDKVLIPLGMMLEYCEKYPTMELIVVRLTQDVDSFDGKYSFRDLNPSKYFDDNGDMRSNVEIDPTENINHVDELAFPLQGDEVNPLFLNDHIDYGREIFLTDTSMFEIIERVEIDEKTAKMMMLSIVGSFSCHHSCDLSPHTKYVSTTDETGTSLNHKTSEDTAA